MRKNNNTSRAKIKTASQEERMQMWEEHFKNLLGSSPKVTNKLINRIINSQQDIPLGQSAQEEINELLKKN